MRQANNIDLGPRRYVQHDSMTSVSCRLATRSRHSFQQKAIPLSPLCKHSLQKHKQPHTIVNEHTHHRYPEKITTATIPQTRRCYCMIWHNLQSYSHPTPNKVFTNNKHSSKIRLHIRQINLLIETPEQTANILLVFKPKTPKPIQHHNRYRRNNE